MKCEKLKAKPRILSSPRIFLKRPLQTRSTKKFSDFHVHTPSCSLAPPKHANFAPPTSFFIKVHANVFLFLHGPHKPSRPYKFSPAPNKTSQADAPPPGRGRGVVVLGLAPTYFDVFPAAFAAPIYCHSGLRFFWLRMVFSFWKANESASFSKIYFSQLSECPSQYHELGFAQPSLSRLSHVS